MRERNLCQTLQIGFGNSIMTNRIIGLFSVDTNPIKKLIADAKNIGLVVDLTKDKKTKTAILMDNDYLILSPINHTTLISRLNRIDILDKNLIPNIDDFNFDDDIQD